MKRLCRAISIFDRADSAPLTLPGLYGLRPCRSPTIVHLRLSHFGTSGFFQFALVARVSPIVLEGLLARTKPHNQGPRPEVRPPFATGPSQARKHNADVSLLTQTKLIVKKILKTKI